MKKWNQDQADELFWLSRTQLTIIASTMTLPKIQALSMKDQLKLLRLLCSIPYAEEMMRLEGKPMLKNIENTLDQLGVKNWVGRTFGTWNLHVCHAKRFGYTQKQFKKLLQNDQNGIVFAIDFILQDIGLHKPVDHILAEYNLEIMATSVAAMQHALNCVMKKYNQSLRIAEDGLIGKHTLEALQLCGQITNIPIPPNTCSEQEIHDFLHIIAMQEQIMVKPFVPQVQIKTNFRFIKEIIGRSLRQFSQLRKLRLIFYNHIDVPLYVHHGMIAYQRLSRLIADPD